MNWIWGSKHNAQLQFESKEEELKLKEIMTDECLKSLVDISHHINSL